MSRLEVLCVTMHQTDFSLVEKMNLKCDAVLSNQTNKIDKNEKEYEWGKVKLISTDTCGVGLNRNNALMFSSGDILLFADEDVRYSDSYVIDVISEFDAHPDADVIIFNIRANSNERKQIENSTTHKLGRLAKLPYGAPRIAIRKKSWENSNVWFTTLFGGGARYSKGEDSIFLHDLRAHGLILYVSNVFLGDVDVSSSSWFAGHNEEFYFSQGAFCKAIHPRTSMIWRLYYCIRIKSTLSFKKRIKAFDLGFKAFSEGKAYADYANLVTHREE